MAPVTHPNGVVKNHLPTVPIILASVGPAALVLIFVVDTAAPATPVPPPNKPALPKNPRPIACPIEAIRPIWVCLLNAYNCII